MYIIIWYCREMRMQRLIYIRHYVPSKIMSDNRKIGCINERESAHVQMDTRVQGCGLLPTIILLSTQSTKVGLQGMRRRPPPWAHAS